MQALFRSFRIDTFFFLLLIVAVAIASFMTMGGYNTGQFHYAGATTLDRMPGLDVEKTMFVQPGGHPVLLGVDEHPQFAVEKVDYGANIWTSNQLMNNNHAANVRQFSLSEVSQPITTIVHSLTI